MTYNIWNYILMFVILCSIQIIFGQSSATATRRIQSAGISAAVAAKRWQTVSASLETAYTPASEDRHLHRGRRYDVRCGAA